MVANNVKLQPKNGKGESIITLTPASLPTAVEYLCGSDADLKLIVDKIGPPPLWDRPPGFPTLVHIILEQQVSLDSAKAAFDKLVDSLNGGLTPEKFLQFSDHGLRKIGFSRQKTSYVRNLARGLTEGKFDLDTTTQMSDNDARKYLMCFRGVGRWTADIYLLMALCRPDIFPFGDLALALALQKVKNLPAKPTEDEIAAIADSWKPYRSVAARILWKNYLNGVK